MLQDVHIYSNYILYYRIPFCIYFSGFLPLIQTRFCLPVYVFVGHYNYYHTGTFFLIQLMLLFQIDVYSIRVQSLLIFLCNLILFLSHCHFLLTLPLGFFAFIKFFIEIRSNPIVTGLGKFQSGSSPVIERWKVTSPSLLCRMTYIHCSPCP